MVQKQKQSKTKVSKKGTTLNNKILAEREEKLREQRLKSQKGKK